MKKTAFTGQEMPRSKINVACCAWLLLMLLAPFEALSAPQEEKIRTTQQQLIDRGFLKSTVSGKVDRQTASALIRACKVDKSFCDRATSFSNAYLLGRLNDFRYALASDRDIYTLMKAPFETIGSLNGKGLANIPTMAAFMSGAVLADVSYSEDGRAHDAIYYNPSIDVSLVLRFENSLPTRAVFTTGEFTRSEPLTSSAPGWLDTAAGRFQKLEDNVKKTATSAKASGKKLENLLSQPDSSSFNTKDSDIVAARMQYLIQEIRDPSSLCAKMLDNEVRVKGGMAALEKKFNRIDPNAGQLANAITFVPAGGFEIGKDRYLRVYANSVDPEYLEFIVVGKMLKDGCDPKAFYFPYLRQAT